MPADGCGHMAYLKHGQLSTKTNGTRDGETVRDGVLVAWFDSKRAQRHSQERSQKWNQRRSRRGSQCRSFSSGSIPQLKVKYFSLNLIIKFSKFLYHFPKKRSSVDFGLSPYLSACVCYKSTVNMREYIPHTYIYVYI